MSASQDPVHFPSVHHPVKGHEFASWGTTSGPEAVRAFQKVLLVDGLQHLADGILDHSVLERRYPYRAASLPLSFGCGHVGWADAGIALAFSRLCRFSRFSCSFRPLLLLRDPIHPYRPILADAVVGPLQAPAHLSDAPRVKPGPSGSRCARSTTFISSGDRFSDVDASVMVPS